MRRELLTTLLAGCALAACLDQAYEDTQDENDDTVGVDDSKADSSGTTGSRIYRSGCGTPIRTGKYALAGDIVTPTGVVTGWLVVDGREDRRDPPDRAGCADRHADRRDQRRHLSRPDRWPRPRRVQPHPARRPRQALSGSRSVAERVALPDAGQGSEERGHPRRPARAKASSTASCARWSVARPRSRARRRSPVCSSLVRNSSTPTSAATRFART